MASGKGTYWANNLLDLLLAGAAFSAPGTTYCAFYTVAPTAAGGGTEATGGGYAREPVVSNTTNWPLAAGGVIANGAPITFTAAVGNWSSGANMVATALWDDISTGNLLYFGSVSTPKPVLTADVASFATGTLTITET